MPILLFGTTAFFLDKSARENQVLESYFRDTTSLINSEFAYDDLVAECTKLKDQLNELKNKSKDPKVSQDTQNLKKDTQNLKKLQERFQTKECDLPQVHHRQTDLVRNTVGGRTILVLKELQYNKNKELIRNFVQTAGIQCWIDPEPGADTKQKYQTLKNTYGIECPDWKPKPLHGIRVEPR